MKLIYSNDIKQIEFDVSILLGFPFSVSLLAYLSINFILPFLHGLALSLSMNQLLLLKLGQQVVLQQNLVVLELLNRLNLQISLNLWLSYKCAPCKREFFYFTCWSQRSQINADDFAGILCLISILSRFLSIGNSTNFLSRQYLIVLTHPSRFNSSRSFSRSLQHHFNSSSSSRPSGLLKISFKRPIKLFEKHLIKLCFNLILRKF